MLKTCKGAKCSKILEECGVSLCHSCTQNFLKKNKPIKTSSTKAAPNAATKAATKATPKVAPKSAPKSAPKAIEYVVAGLIDKHIMGPALRKK